MMGEIINYPNVAIEVNRTEEFHTIARELSDFIEKLPLYHEQNERLIKLIVKQVQQAEEDAFTQGFEIGSHFKQNTTK